MAIVQQVIGNTVAEWDDAVPLAWKMSETTGPKNYQQTQTISFDLRELCAGYEDAFLLTLKGIVIARRNRIALKSIKKEIDQTRVLLRNVQTQRADAPRVTHIDHAFLLTLRTIHQDVPIDYLRGFRQLYSENRESPLFAPNLVPEDFPMRKPIKGFNGKKSLILSPRRSRAPHKWISCGEPKMPMRAAPSTSGISPSCIWPFMCIVGRPAIGVLSWPICKSTLIPKRR